MIKHKGVWVREGTWDIGVVDQQRGHDALGIEPGDVVLDIGGNIGSFARYAVERGAKFVLTVEPERDNFEVLLTNVRDFGDAVRPFEAAVVSREVHEREGGEIPIYINEEGINKATHSTVPVRGRPFVMVPTVTLDELFTYAQFTAVKVDVEGAEYGLELDELPSSVTKLNVEYHMTKKAFRLAAPKLHAMLLGEGWVPTHDFTPPPKIRSYMMFYAR